MRVLLTAILTLALSAPSLAATLRGTASAVDGDAIEVPGERTRLHGIDAPETAQTCKRRNGQEWQCGQQAAAV
jgi:endonuclease YncB( thermonuclease family)